TALDVVEIDAASNRGVDDARDLRERAMYAPSEEGRYKIYIVDEAHMLTREAWNALLKILEEPTPRVIFVFATTEPQKIQQAAAPILSRCQRFDFRRIGVSDIVARLQQVLADEGHPGPEDALRILARKADGGMRDGLSLLDQVLALSGGEITQDAVRRVLGLVEEERYLDLLDILQAGQHGAVFGYVQALLDEGYDLSEFYTGLVDTLRALLRLRLSPDEPIPEISDHVREPFAARAAVYAPEDLVRMLSLASELEASGSLRRSGNPRLLLEMLLLRLSYLDRTVDLEELLRGLGGAPLGDPPGPPATSPAAESRAPRAPAPTPRKGSPARGVMRDAAPAPDADPAAEPAAASPGHAPAETAAGPPPDAPARPAVPPTPRDLQDAWGMAVDRVQGLPGGTGGFLRGGSAERRPDGGVTVTVQEAVLERLTPAHQGALQGALGVLLGTDVALEIRAAGAAPTEGTRISQDVVREGRLRELIREEPALEHAVRELDLELLD
ncbi:MAG TPA: DNA polymerase III subunit gamma/tau, partial [Longimicrobiales bacterium]|nr:DNA polymerase III subunit gamma/tau [Longimicrobiales bacterium]